MGEKEKKVYLTTEEGFTLQQLAEKIALLIDYEDAALFIALLNEKYRDWEITKKLICHFKAMEISFNDEFPDEEKNQFIPEHLT